MKNKALPWVLLALALLAIALLSRANDDTGEPLDPRSTGPLGARGLVLLLDEMGADVTIGAEARGDVAVLLVDELGRGQTTQVREWVEAGGTLIVVDPLSEFAPALGRSAGLFGSTEDEFLRPDCPLRAVGRVGRVTAPDAALFRVKPGAVGCFHRGESAYLVAREEGDGVVVALGGGAPFINDHLGDVDNAVLAVALMAPTPGTQVTVLERAAIGSGDESLTDLVPRSVRTGIWQLGIAAVALMLWRARRVGKPVLENQPVAIPGSELVVATGNLLQHAGRRDAAAEMLRSQLRRDLASRFGLPPDATFEHVRDLLSQRGVPAAQIAAALASRAVTDDRDLVLLAGAIESLRKEVMHA